MWAGEAQRWPGVAVPPAAPPPLSVAAGAVCGRPLMRTKARAGKASPFNFGGPPAPGRDGREGGRGCTAPSGRASFPAAARAGGRGALVSVMLARASPPRAERDYGAGGGPAPPTVANGRCRPPCPPALCFPQPQRRALPRRRAAGRRRLPPRLRSLLGVPRGGLGQSQHPPGLRQDPERWAVSPAKSASAGSNRFNFSVACFPLP